MKALTICQPYAEQIARGEKILENRTWPTNYRGPLAIHAGKSRAWMEDGDEAEYPRMAFGAVVAIAELVDCRRVTDLSAEMQERHDANGPFCFVLANVRRIEPVPARGAQGLWDIDEAQLSERAS